MYYSNIYVSGRYFEFAKLTERVGTSSSCKCKRVVGSENGVEITWVHFGYTNSKTT